MCLYKNKEPFSRNSSTMGTTSTTHQELLKTLQKKKAIRTDRVLNVMAKVDRTNFCSYNPYDDSPQSIGHGATISAPHMHAYALELLRDHLAEGRKALDVGSGSGYLTVCFALMVGAEGKAVGIEHIEELVKKSKRNTRKAGLSSLMTEGRLRFVVGDGRKGFAEDGPYHAMHVGAAARDLPDVLVEQLAPGGRLVIPIGASGDFQYFEQVDKDGNGTVSRKKLLEVRYVPLTDRESQTKNKLFL